MNMPQHATAPTGKLSLFKPPRAKPKTKPKTTRLPKWQKRVSFQQIERDFNTLCRKLDHHRTERKRHGHDYTGVVCIAKGGFLIGKMLAGHMQLPLGVVYAQRYQQAYTKGKTFVDAKIQWSDGKQRKPKAVLVADDLIDEGRTMHAIIRGLGNHYPRLRNPENLDLIAFYHKPNRIEVDLSAHTAITARAVDEFIIFPWEKGPVESKASKF